MKKCVAMFLLVVGLLGLQAAPGAADPGSPGPPIELDPACDAVHENMGPAAGNLCRDLREQCRLGDPVACLFILVP